MDATDLNKFVGAVSDVWLPRGTWLSQAWKTIPSAGLYRAKEIAEKFAKSRGDESFSAVFFASEESIDSPPAFLTYEERSLWRQFCDSRAQAVMDIFNYMKVNGGPLYAFGSPSRAGAAFEWIPILAWKQLRPVDGQKDIVAGGGNIYYDVHVVNPSSWQDSSPAPSSKVIRTGSAGRPTSKHLAIEEMRQRHIKGALKSTLKDEATYLLRWLAENHPNNPRALIGSFENSIRASYWKLIRSENP